MILYQQNIMAVLGKSKQYVNNVLTFLLCVVALLLPFLRFMQCTYILIQALLLVEKAQSMQHCSSETYKCMCVCVCVMCKKLKEWESHTATTHGLSFPAIVGKNSMLERPQVGAVPHQALPLLQFSCIIFAQAKFRGRKRESLGLRLQVQCPALTLHFIF